MKRFKTASFIFFIAAILGITLGFSFAPPSAEANFFTDFFRNFVRPLGTSTAPAPAAPATVSAPLYKPAIDYEKAVIAAVKSAAPAVVSITISKNVPIIERCPLSPFSGLPDEFREFFGDFPQLYGQCQKGTRLQEVGGGSGFIVSPDGLILTNKHVVSDSEASYTVFTNDGKKYEAKVLARDPAQDLAVIKISANGLPTLELGDSDTVELGQTAISIGNALGEFRNTVSVGVISGLSRTINASGGGVSERLQGVIQTDAAINQGNSGGPLLNLRGQVIGINTAIVSGAQNIGFAIPVNRAKRDVQSVKSTGEIQAPFLGVRYFLVTPEIAKREKLPLERGALVRGTEDGPAVEPNSPAEKAGLKAEDIIYEVNGKQLDKDFTLGDAIAEYRVGQTITLRIRRGSQDLVLSATLAKRPPS